MSSKKEAAILIQGHVPKFDPQGDLTSDQKLEMFDLSLKEIRRLNREAYIVLTGHGVEQPIESRLADWVFWEQAYPIDSAGLVVGYPAQFRWLGIGLEHIKEMGFKNCLKTRLDCLIVKPYILFWCQQQTQQENKQFIFTQMTGEPNFLGDCFVYGPTEALLFTWNKNNHFLNADGLIQTAEYFKFYFPDSGMNWKDFLRSRICFRDLYEIPFIDLRWNWREIEKDLDFKYQLYDNEIINKYLWGKKNGWFVFDNDGNLISTSRPEMWSRKQFYE